MASSLFRRAGEAVMLNAVGNWIGMFGSLLSIIFIARILSPEEFGVFAMMLVVFSLPETPVTGSLNDSLIQRRELRPGHTNSVLVQSLVLAAIFSIGVNLLAPLIASGF